MSMLSDNLLLGSHQYATNKVTNSNEYILSDPVSAEDGTGRYLNSTESKGTLDWKMDMKDINMIIKQELPDCKNECLDVAISKDLVKRIKLEVLDSGLENHEEILPDLTNTLITPIKDELTIKNKLHIKDDINECLDVAISKDLVKRIKFKVLDSGLENHEEILPDLPNTLITPIKDEPTIKNKLHMKDDTDVLSLESETTNDLEDKVKQLRPNHLSAALISCDSIKATSRCKTEISRKWRDWDKNNMNKSLFKLQHNNKPLFNETHKIMKQRNESEGNDYLFYLVRTKQKSSGVCKTKSENKSDIISNKSIMNKKMMSTTTSNISVEIPPGEVCDNVGTEKNSDTKCAEGNMDINGDFSEEHDEYCGFESAVCCGNIFCECNGCKSFRKPALKYKCKPDKQHVCGFCNKSYNRKNKLKEHMETKCGTVKTFSCEICARGFTSVHAKKTHIINIHTKNKSKKILKLKCDVCSKTFSSKTHLNRHKINIHLVQNMNLTYYCEICRKVFKTERSLVRHKGRHGGEEFECGHCAKIYSNKESLRNHIQSAHFQGPVECDSPSCKKIFATALALKRHERLCQSKSVDACFICEICGKRFIVKNQLQRHILIHTDEKCYMCHVCGKNFQTESNLFQHSRTHSDIRPFSCNLCPKAFRIKHHLRQHMAVHGLVHI